LLELAFKTKELRSVCEDAAHAEALYGPVVTAALVGRLADLRAAEHLLQLPFAEVRPAGGDDPEHIVIALTAGRSLVLAANHVTPPRAPDGAIAWEHVNRVRILRLE
jgi:hypothetical protein